MNLIEIVHSEGMGIAEPIMPGDSIAVEAGDTISYNVALDAVTGIVRVGDDLYLTVQESATTRLEGYFFFDFSVKPLMLNFTDVQLSVSDVKELFDLSLDKVDSEGHNQVINLRSGSIVPVGFNEIYYCDAEQYNLKNLQRHGDDLFLMSTEQPDQAKIILQGFFILPEPGQEPPQLQLTDPKSGTAKDVLIHPQSAVFGWQGEPLPRAVEGALYAYYFKLESQDADNFNLTATANGEELPRWLTFAFLGKGQYLLWGLPPHEAVGELHISIYAHSLNQKIGLHTQQAFPLAILSANDTITRPGVDDVAAAEFRKLEGQLAGENYTNLVTMSEATLPYMSGAEIAAVSVLAAANFNVYGRSLDSGGSLYEDVRLNSTETPISMQYFSKGDPLQTIDEPESVKHALPGAESVKSITSVIEDAASEPIAPTESDTETSLPMTETLFENDTTEETDPPEPIEDVLAEPNSGNDPFQRLGINQPPEPEPPLPSPDESRVIFGGPPTNGNGVATLWFQTGPLTFGTTDMYGVATAYMNFAKYDLATLNGQPVKLALDSFTLTVMTSLTTSTLVIDGDALSTVLLYPGAIHLDPIQSLPGYTTYTVDNLPGAQGVFPPNYITTLHINDAVNIVTNIDVSLQHGLFDIRMVNDSVAANFGYSTTIINNFTTQSPGPNAAGQIISSLPNESPDGAVALIHLGIGAPTSFRPYGYTTFTASVGGDLQAQVTNTGDITGDGFNDVLMVTPSSATNSAWVLFGQSSFANGGYDLATLASTGDALQITATPLSYFTSGNTLGDVTGDGFADILLADANLEQAYIIFGATPTSLGPVIDVTALDGNNGILLYDSNPTVTEFAEAVGGVDITGDGFNATFIAKYNSSSGSSVVAIQTELLPPSASVDIDAVAIGQIVNIYDSVNPSAQFSSITNLGDVNNDGVDDVAVVQQGTLVAPAAIYVIFGDANFFSNSTFNLATMTSSQGFTLTTTGYSTISSIAYAGDTNGDNIADFVFADRYSGSSGVAHLIFGSESGLSGVIDYRDLSPNQGVSIYNGSSSNISQVGGGGDINGDGLYDVTVSNAVNLGSPVDGTTYVIYGGNFTNNITQVINRFDSTINGTAGDDVIYTGGGNFIINLGTGTTFLNTGIGTSFITGTTGDATIVYSPLLGNITAGTGNNTLVFQQDGTTADFTSTFFTGINNIDLKALQSLVGNAITLDPNSVANMTIGSDTMTINGGGHDRVTLLNNVSNSWVGSAPDADIVGYTTYTSTSGSIAYIQNIVSVTITDPFTIIYPSPGDGGEVSTLWFQNGPGAINFIGQNEYFNFATLRLEADGNVPVNLSIDGVGLTNLLNNTGQLFIDGVLIDSTRVFPGDIHLSPVQNTPGYTTYIANDGSILQISNDVVITSYVDVATDLNGNHGFVVSSLHPSGSFSYYSTITDLNGDGQGDLVIADPFFYNEVTVIFGSSTPFAAQIDASSPGVQSVVFTGSYAGAVSAAGDFNGDGFGDLLISAPFGNTAFIVFGQASFGPSADLPTLASSGGAMEITTYGDFTGGTGLGDINGDGLADIAINNNINGNVYVVLGTTTPPTSLNVSTLNGTNGFTIVTTDPSFDSSISDITFTDINGDGYNDVLFKTQITGPDTETVWAIFGKAGGFPAVIDTSTLASGDGFAIIDSSIGSYRAFGRHISNIGDINNDGVDDVAIGERSTGNVYVIFGSPAFSSGTTFDVATLDGTNGFTLTHASYLFIRSIAFAGDVNGDGIADMVLGDYSANGFEGAAYVIFGSEDPFTAIVDMIQTDPTKGLTIQHYSQGNGLVSVGGGGDVNGDGLGDIILSNSDLSPPAANIIFGANFSNTITILGNDSQFVINGTGNDVIFAGTADHTINLGTGNNYVNTGTGNNTINGNVGNDTIVYSPLIISVNGSAGLDTLLFQQDGLSVNFATAFNYFGIDEIDLKAMQTLMGNNIILDPAAVLRMSDSNVLTINGSAHESVTLQANVGDAWTSSTALPGYTTYTSVSGSVVNIQNTITQVTAAFAPFVLADNALTGTDGFLIEDVSYASSIDSSRFGSTIAIIHNAVGDGLDYLFINSFFNGPGETGEAYLVPGSTAVQPASLTADNPSLNTIIINAATSLGPFFSIASLGGFTGAGENNLAFILGGGPPYANVLLDPINTLSSSQDIATLNTISLANGPFNSMSVAAIGDVNGDGLTDMALFSYWVPNMYVIFGTTTPPAYTDLSALNGSDGYEIQNPSMSTGSDNVPLLISANINGDGFNDIIYHYTSSYGYSYADVVVVVLGQSAAFPSPVSNTALITGGQAFNITDSANPSTGFGKIMADIGNFRGSSNDDFAIANPTTGSVYVLFGDTAFNTSTSFDVSSLNGTNGFALTAPVGDIITAVGGVGDVNGDGYADMAAATYNSGTEASNIYVIFGNSDPFPASMSLVPNTATDGFIIQHFSRSPYNNEIGAITGADFNGDGLSDIVYSERVGTYVDSLGGVYVIFGDNFSNHITIQGTGTPSVINGTNNDVIYAGSNDQTINLGPGDNFVNTGTGNDIVNGGSGNDTIVFSEFLVSVNGGSGNDTLLFQQDGIIEDFTASAIFSGIDNIDLKALLSNVGNKIELDAATISAMSDNNHITVNGGGMDVLTLSNDATDMWSSVVGSTYTTYTANGGLYVGTSVDVANTMQLEIMTLPM